MKLATRVSAFFLSALALILVADSVLVFVVAMIYLERRFDEQLQSSLHTLVAAVEVEDDDVKWEPSDHTVTLGVESGTEDVRWIVLDEQGRRVDQSPNLAAPHPGPSLSNVPSRQLMEGVAPEGWRVSVFSLRAPHPKPLPLRTELEHAALTVVVARGLADHDAALRFFGVTLLVLPLVCWLGAAVAGQWFCRRTIAPVQEMASAVRGMRADDTRARLCVPETHDELEELGRAFNELLDELFRGYDLQRRFAGDAAHQLRTPLTVLQGHIEVALRKSRSAGEYVSTLGVIHEETLGLRQTVETLLWLARPQDPFPADWQCLILDAWLEKYLEKWRGDPRIGALTVQAEMDMACYSSPNLLTQLLGILISNAVKYSSLDARIAVSARHREGRLILEVVDQGIGISPEDLPLIFRPFFRTAEARQAGAPGNGLGLAIADRITSALGGKMTCESQLGKGTHFTVWLPTEHPSAPSSLQG